MAITINIYYTGKGENAKKFAEEMVSSGVVDAIRSERGNLRYDYFFPMEDKETGRLSEIKGKEGARDAGFLHDAGR